MFVATLLVRGGPHGTRLRCTPLRGSTWLLLLLLLLLPRVQSQTLSHATSQAWCHARKPGFRIIRGHARNSRDASEAVNRTVMYRLVGRKLVSVEI